MTGIEVHVEIDGRTHPVGELFSTVRRNRINSMFAYDRDYVARATAYAIESALPLTTGNWAVGRALPRSFEDAAPDRWGRNLIATRLRAEAVGAGRAVRWALAPAFDINPNPELGAERVTSIGGSVGPVSEMHTLLATASSFDLTETRAKRVAAEVADAVRAWPQTARGNGIVEAEIARFQPVLDTTLEVVMSTAG